MTQVIEMGELQDVKEQFILLAEKLEKQKILVKTKDNKYYLNK